jgi:dTDP-4-dehydrorhamnose reductase
MKILITGGAGLVARHLSAILERETVIAATRDMLDVTDIDSAISFFREIKPDAVFHLAAFTDVDGCEEKPGCAFLVNGLGTRNIAIAAADSGAFFVYVSTDFVFDGLKKEPYRESDRTEPISVYGTSKLSGEYFTRNISRKWLIVRTSRVFGKGGRNFGSRLPLAIKQQKKLQLTEDLFNCPTYAADLAQALKTLCKNGAEGTIHFANYGWCNWYEFGLHICKQFGVPANIIESVKSSDMRLKARRPAFSALDTSLFSSIVRVPRPWQEALNEYLREVNSV